jgi:hypothetical protein
LVLTQLSLILFADYEPVSFKITLNPIQGISAAVLEASSPRQWNLIAQNLWKFDVMLSDTAGLPSPSSKIGSCDALNVTVVANQISCSFFYSPSYGMVVDPRFYVAYIFSGAYYAKGVFASPEPTRNFSGTCTPRKHFLLAFVMTVYRH